MGETDAQKRHDHQSLEWSAAHSETWREYSWSAVPLIKGCEVHTENAMKTKHKDRKWSSVFGYFRRICSIKITLFCTINCDHWLLHPVYIISFLFFFFLTILWSIYKLDPIEFRSFVGARFRWVQYSMSFTFVSSLMSNNLSFKNHFVFAQSTFMHYAFAIDRFYVSIS